MPTRVPGPRSPLSPGALSLDSLPCTIFMVLASHPPLSKPTRPINLALTGSPQWESNPAFNRPFLQVHPPLRLPTCQLSGREPSPFKFGGRGHCDLHLARYSTFCPQNLSRFFFPLALNAFDDPRGASRSSIARCSHRLTVLALWLQIFIHRPVALLGHF